MSAADRAALRVERLRGGYMRGGRGRRIFEDLSLDAPEGRFTALAGPNGSGKSTLFRFILKGLRPESGRILVAGRDIAGLAQVELARLVAFIPQYYLLPRGFSVEQVVSMADFAGRVCPPARIAAVLEEVGIASLAGRDASELSGGEAQLVMLARAICCEAPLVLMDEPTSNLDINRRAHLLETAKALTREGRTVFCAIHDLNLVLKHADWCHVLKNGSLRASGAPDEVIDEALVEDVFEARSRIIRDPVTGRKVLLD